jgi:hypothetical protein
MIAPALAPLAPTCPNATKCEETYIEWALPQPAPVAPAKNDGGAAMAALRTMAARWRVPGYAVPLTANEHAPLAGLEMPEGDDDPEREAMAAHYAAPPSAYPYLPGDPCDFRDGLLLGAQMAADACNAAECPALPTPRPCLPGSIAAAFRTAIAAGARREDCPAGGVLLRHLDGRELWARPDIAAALGVEIIEFMEAKGNG